MFVLFANLASFWINQLKVAQQTAQSNSSISKKIQKTLVKVVSVVNVEMDVMYVQMKIFAEYAQQKENMSYQMVFA
jgi:hypothetical protein